MISGFGLGGILIMHVMWLVPVGIAIYRSIIRPSDHRLETWMNARGLHPDGSEREFIEPHLYLTRWVRSVGFIVGWSVPFVEIWVARSAYVQTSNGEAAVIAGYALGVVLGELLAPRRARRVTSIEPRHISQYVPRSGKWAYWLWLFPSALALYGTTRNVEYFRPIVPYEVFLFAGPAILLAGGIAIRWIVQRPQPATSAAHIRADDALRASAAQAILGCVYAGVILTWQAVIRQLGYAEPPLPTGWIGQLLGISAFFATFAAIGVLLAFTADEVRWVVPRARTVAE